MNTQYFLQQLSDRFLIVFFLTHYYHLNHFIIFHNFSHRTIIKYFIKIVVTKELLILKRNIQFY
jgi:hypothetical protein